MTATRPIRALIYGSCASRDTFQYLPQGRFTIAKYVARQSLISAYSTPLTHLPDSAANLPSDFQRRMQRDDLMSTLPGLLSDIGREIDVVLWDLIDERLGIYQLPGGEVVTRSLELIASGLNTEFSRVATYIEFGSDIHYSMWVTALDQFLASLEQLSPRPALRLLAIPWAEHNEDGRPTPPSFALYPVNANRMYRRYYSRAAQRGVRVVTTRYAPLSSSVHQWGEAPFHYDDATYQAAAEAFMRSVFDPEREPRLREGP